LKNVRKSAKKIDIELKEMGNPLIHAQETKSPCASLQRGEENTIWGKVVAFPEFRPW
jgi:hypothetical protein